MTQDKETLIRSIEAHLIEETHAARGSPVRTAWLVSQIQEYIERWLGFCELPDIPMQAMVSGDLFTTIEAAAELLEKELNANNVVMDTQAWSQFLYQLSSITSSQDKMDAQRLQESFAKAKLAMS